MKTTLKIKARKTRKPFAKSDAGRVRRQARRDAIKRKLCYLLDQTMAAA